MAYYFIYPEKDTTLYSHPNRTTMNSGNDEILEIVKEKGTTNSIYYPSRILIKFKDDDIKTTISDVIGHSKFNDGTSSFALKLYSTEHKNLSTPLTLETFAASQSWDEGTGRFSNLPTSSNGSSWIYRDNDITKTEWTTSSFASGTSGSINAPGITEGGGTWFTGSNYIGSQSFTKNETLDTNIDVTNIVTQFSASLFAGGGIENQGFIVKQVDSVETNTSNSFGELKYFSSDTHTIYPPKLCFKWDDSQHNNQSSAKQSGELSVSLYRNKSEYNQNDIAKFRVHVRDKYPVRQFTSSSNYLNTGYFTTSSYYSIRDAHTEEEVIPFDDTFTKMSSDAEGMYFNIYMKSLQPERYYRLLFKHTNHDGTSIYDEKHHFKVIR
tara:strand:- start:1711 stop:2853 length:1143 start_codon:yes stop_codon:yes gene_type:complete